MNDKVTRISLDAVARGATDWARLRALTEAEIEAAIAEDLDTFSLADGDGVLVKRRHLRLIERASRTGRYPSWARPLRRSELRSLRAG